MATVGRSGHWAATGDPIIRAQAKPLANDAILVFMRIAAIIAASGRSRLLLDDFHFDGQFDFVAHQR
jgi:hypothetical protein